jgi:hypothetical protein
MREMRYVSNLWLDFLKEKDQLGDLDANGRIIQRKIFEEKYVNV